MKKKFLKRMSILAFGFILLCSSVLVQAEEEITPSNVYYDVTLRDASGVFIGNKTAVDWKVGDSYFLTYTVSSLTKDATAQCGVMVTPDRDGQFPYKEGGMLFDQKSLICEEGYTYFFRFDVTEDGFEYVAGKANDDGSSYVKFPHTYGQIDTKAPYFGIWIGEGEGVSAELIQVRCYDKNGTDLGVYAPAASAISISEMTTMENINHSYAFSVVEANCVAFGAARKTESDVIFMEYTVSNVKAENLDQSGALMTNDLKTQYPHGSNMGYLNYTPHQESAECKLITEGAHYLVRFECGEKKFDVLVKRTLSNGAVDYFSFNHFAGAYSDTYGYVAMWIGNMCSLTADFTDVKCYDIEGNNLGIQTNKNVKVQHFGDLEDYSQCEAVYYCKENDTYIALENDCVASRRIDGEVTADMGSYSIRDSIMTLKIGNKTEEFDYLYEFFTDKDDNKYVRLREWNVTFKSKRIGGDVLETVQVTAENGFKVEVPEEPTRKGHTFVNWIEGDGQAYNFAEVVTEAKTLYASWDGEDSWLATGFFQENDMSRIIVAGICVIIVGITGIAIAFVRKKGKHGK